jgi:fatty-acyl-CoA synthase
MHIGNLLTQRASLTPDRVAVVDVHTSTNYTFDELNQRANRLANAFTDRFGLEKGDRVSILANNSVAYLDLFYGLGKTGVIFAPLNWRLVSRELAYILNDCQPEVLICGPEFVEVVEGLRSEMTLPKLVSIEGAAFEESDSYEEILENAPPTEPDRPSLDGEDPYCILYTSGTTGQPKGALIPHRQVLWNCINTVTNWGLRETDISPIFTPLFHAGGLFAFMLPLHYIGGRVVLTRTFDAQGSLKTIEGEGCTVILGVPTLFRLWMDAPNFGQVDFSQVRWFISGGAPCPVSLIKEWYKTKQIVLRQGYGLTEVGVNCFSMTDEQSLAKIGSVGKPMFHSQMRIVDERDQEVPIGDVGELTIAGPHVCRGYWRNPEATTETLRDGWFHTGDMAQQDEEGFYYIAGRYKDMIISGGENIYAAEVEAVILEHPDVEEVALIGEPSEKWGETGLAVVVTQGGTSPSEQALIEFCHGKLARYKIPKRVVFTDALPYSPYGKVMKDVLKKQFVKS